MTDKDANYPKQIARPRVQLILGAFLMDRLSSKSA